jgi:hypothetical protein
LVFLVGAPFPSLAEAIALKIYMSHSKVMSIGLTESRAHTKKKS